MTTMLNGQEGVDKLVQMLRAGTEVPLLVTGSSMVPFLRNRKDTVFLRAPGAAPLRTGDIVFFLRSNGQPVLHRIVRIDQTKITVCGDAQVWTEEITPRQVEGVVFGMSRNGKHMASPQRWDRRLEAAIWWRLRPLRPGLLRAAVQVKSRFHL